MVCYPMQTMNAEREFSHWIESGLNVSINVDTTPCGKKI